MILSAAVEGKNRPVATNFQFLKISCPSGTSLLQCICISEVILLGRACPKPCSYFAPLVRKKGVSCLHSFTEELSETTGGSMNKTNVKANPSTTHRHDTPNNKTHIIKFRVTETEKFGTRTNRKNSFISPCPLSSAVRCTMRRSSALLSLPAAEKKP